MNQCIQTNVPEVIVFAIAFEKENVADVVTWAGTRFGIGAIFLLQSLKSSKAPTNYFTPNILRKSWSRLVVSVVHLDALAFPVAAT